MSYVRFFFSFCFKVFSLAISDYFGYGCVTGFEYGTKKTKFISQLSVFIMAVAGTSTAWEGERSAYNLPKRKETQLRVPVCRTTHFYLFSAVLVAPSDPRQCTRRRRWKSIRMYTTVSGLFFSRFLVVTIVAFKRPKITLESTLCLREHRLRTWCGVFKWLYDRSKYTHKKNRL